MPELAELKFTADYVNEISEGQTYVRVEKNPIHKCEDLNIPFKKFKIKAVSKGKEMVLYFLDKLSDQYIPVRITMGMSGHFKLTNTGQEPKHAHLKFYRSDGTTMSFVDVRRFGKWKQGVAWSENRGPDPTTEFDMFWTKVMTNLTKLNKPLYEVLMDQKYFNGIGNYLRAEIIYRAGDVDPFLPAGMQFARYPKLLELCRDIPLLAYAKGGGSIKDWDNPFGDDSIQEKFMLCYGNDKMSKRKDRNGRTFWYDPKWDDVPTSRDDLGDYLRNRHQHLYDSGRVVE
jgi:endonuclease VIII-like 1